MKRVMKYLALTALAVSVAPQAMAQCTTPTYDAPVSVWDSAVIGDGVALFPIGGSGQVNTNFSSCSDSTGIQLGMSIIERNAGPIAGPGGVYTAPQGAATDGNALWNFQMHIDMGYAYGAGNAPLTLADLDSLVLQLDCDPVAGSVQGLAVDLKTLTGLPNLFFPDTAVLIQASDNLGFTGRCLGTEFDPAADGSYEFSLTATYQGNEIGQATATAVVGSPPPAPEPGETATFTVVKAYGDLNTAPVDVQLTCTSGLPLEQDFVLDPFYVDSVNNSVTFVLDTFEDGVPNCTVTETAAAGYVAQYQDISGTGTADADGCHYDAVALGTEAACVIINAPLPVDVTISKVWNAGDVEATALIALTCTDVIPGSREEWIFVASTVFGDDDYIAQVQPLATGATCVVLEDNGEDSAVETEGCEAPLSVMTGSPTGCTLVNTVFFEGIPTLNQYGMMLMALLMLGVGFVGFRRFA